MARPGKKLARKLAARLNGYAITMSNLGRNSKTNPLAYKRPGSKPGSYHQGKV
jgi:hypothetical protein